MLEYHKYNRTKKKDKLVDNKTNIQTKRDKIVIVMRRNFITYDEENKTKVIKKNKENTQSTHKESRVNLS